MDFSAALLAVKDGKPVRRAFWNARGEYADAWKGITLVRVEPPPLPDGTQFVPRLEIKGEDGRLRPFIGGSDLDADDWELAE